jgi:hypothetical protein
LAPAEKILEYQTNNLSAHLCMAAPHLGHLRDFILNPGLGGTSSPQAAQVMVPGTFRLSGFPTNLLLSFLKLNSLRTGFWLLRWDISFLQVKFSLGASHLPPAIIILWLRVLLKE